VNAHQQGDAAAKAVDFARLRLSAHIGWFLAKPLSFIDVGHESLSALPPGMLRSLAEYPEFSSALNRAVAAILGLESLEFGAELVQRLTASAAGRLAVAMLTAPEDTLESAAAILATAIIHRRVANAVMKEERNTLRNLLGDQLFRLAVHEAPVMHAPLGELDRGHGDTSACSRPTALPTTAGRSSSRSAGRAYSAFSMRPSRWCRRSLRCVCPRPSEPARRARRFSRCRRPIATMW
jgi:hypothetical protein